MNIRIGAWINDLRLGVKAGLQAAPALKPESIALDAFDPEISARNLSLSGRRDLARHARGVAPLAALKADVGGRGLAEKQHLDANLGRVSEAFALARDLGVQRVVVNAGFVPEEKKENTTVRDALAEAARALIAMTSTTGVRVCWLAGSEPAAVLAAFLNSVDSSGILEVDLNPGAIVMRGGEPLDALNALSSRVSLARAVDHYRGGAEAPFGKGDVRWGEVLIGLSTLSRNEPIDLLAGSDLNTDRTAALGAAVKKLKDVRARPV